ncbi:MAG TPA: phosphoenolpyruvate--protein phosphotransferase [Deltaproteobacteria bacterium]|jgi:phosphotransferase system enzyme I (PtsI)|nr:phosphoenolpyruvate--protein phosphotransferase [Deltaproteobacteria bacterium]OQC28828.1 MAG: Phosphoenolpyruvate-protein phosphotransferase [Deltaproteobacteria bacterium ADurb.Bin072]HRW80309.1 phosphoenolpyruvate--protein phosphotransferase [Desulfomonilia bacterium]HNQ86341.1 phosphoenolpyruvate--protein phosphotransferase [Deltaproteobacteria bacterium]HNS89294.1 phosphoenolpyruvate--protein phosphotransferase [Deltaproteobacteria bacterium]
MPQQQVHILHGVPASAGIAIGQAVVIDTKKIERYPKLRVSEDRVEDELGRFEHAVQLSQKQITEAIHTLEAHQVIREHILILETHLLMLKDPALVDRVKQLITEDYINAEWALKIALREIEEAIEAIDDEYIRSRVTDTSFVGERLLRNLVGKTTSGFHLAENSIVVAHDLSPADTAMLNKGMVLGFATDVGGITSHTAIIAHSLEIPAVVGLENASSLVNPGDNLILDGISGVVIVNPSESQVLEYQTRARSYLSLELKLKEKAKEPAITKDGKYIKVKGNLEFKEEVRTVLDHGAEGVGLYRTEFLYLVRKEIPSEQDHFEAYKSVVETVSPFNTVIRTLDLGGDKFYSALSRTINERNPVMGLRAIRLCLKETDIFRTQLRGILRASHYGNTSIMFPMISGIEELERAKEILEETKKSLSIEGIPFDENIRVGIMVEVPSAAVIADLLAKEVDFFSLGTNDLIQYSLAIDRGNEYVNYLYEPLHPAVLRLIQFTVDAAHNAGIPVSMCGEMAGREIYTPILLGMGIDSLSANAFAISHVKEMARKISIDNCKSIVSHIFEMKTASEIYEFMSREIMEKARDIFELA